MPAPQPVSVTLFRYPVYGIPAAVLSMALFHIPLWISGRISFYKLFGTGRNGGFDKRPNWQQWALLMVHTGNPVCSNKQYLGWFINFWTRIWNAEVFTIWLEPLESHGSWDGKTPFNRNSEKGSPVETIVVLTRATIRFNRLQRFWSHVDEVARQMQEAPGLLTSFGIGEVPYIKQATLSVWKDAASMKSFAYQLPAHQEVIRKTRSENWYREELFARFRLIEVHGTLNGSNPLTGIL